VRKSRTGRVALAIIGGLSVLVALGFTVRQYEPEAQAPVPAMTASSADGEPADVCQNFPSRSSCTAISVDGRALRYTIRRPARPTRETVIVDFGGPGVPVLANDYPSLFSGIAPAVFQQYNVVAVDEPWAVQDASVPCRTALSEFHRAVRATAGGSAPQRAAEMRERCDVQSPSGHRWGFDAASYRAVVSAVGQKENLSYIGFIGQSFGSARLAYLTGPQGTADLRWAILSKPFPVGATAGELIEARRAATENIFTRLAGRRPASTAIPQINRFDELSAQVELGYLAEEAQKQAAIQISKADSDVVSRLSDQLWLRYGGDLVSPAYLAQTDELCNALGPQQPTAYTSVADLLAVQLMPCRGREPFELSLGKMPLCVAASDRDAVSPGALVRKSLARASSHTLWVSLKDSSHTAEGGVSDCLAAMKKEIGASGPS
jgi:hypothetical protein